MGVNRTYVGARLISAGQRLRVLLVAVVALLFLARCVEARLDTFGIRDGVVLVGGFSFFYQLVNRCHVHSQILYFMKNNFPHGTEGTELDM